MDQAEYKIFFDQHYTALCFFAHSIVMNMEEAEDIVQESFCKLWNKKEDFEIATANVKAFLYMVVKNACLDYLRQQKRLSTHEQEIMS
jgi:RNA polymerase sigma-70 factor (ECF subfamily)